MMSLWSVAVAVAVMVNILLPPESGPHTLARDTMGWPWHGTDFFAASPLVVVLL
jgi:hypothetical protein